MSEPCARCGQPIDIHANPITVDERHPLWGEPLCYDCANEYDYRDAARMARERADSPRGAGRMTRLLRRLAHWLLFYSHDERESAGGDDALVKS